MTPPHYDIVLILEENDSPAKVLFSLWENLSPHDYHELLEEEKIVFDAWSFDSTFGNGIDDLLANENYDVIANGFRAMRVLGLSRLQEFVATLENVFAVVGINCASGDAIAKVEELSDSQSQRLQQDLKLAERPFLEDFWEACILIHAAHDYLMSHLEIFRRRK